MRSSPPLASMRPSWLNAAHSMAALPVRGWLSIRGCAGSAASHSRTAPSELPLARMSLAGLSATELTSPAPAVRDEDWRAPHAVGGQVELGRQRGVAGAVLEGFGDDLVVDGLVTLVDRGRAQ